MDRHATNVARDDKVWCVIVLLSQILRIVSLRATRSNPLFIFVSHNVSLGYCVPCAYPRICSNCAIACFHIQGFIASHISGVAIQGCNMSRVARTLFTGLLRVARNDKGKTQVTNSEPWVTSKRIWIASRCSQ